MQSAWPEVEQTQVDTMRQEPQKNAGPNHSFRVCMEGKRLLDLFGAAVQEVVLLHEHQFLAVVAGDANAHRFDILIHDANEKKQNAKYVYLRHLEEHGCSLDNEIDHS